MADLRNVYVDACCFIDLVKTNVGKAVLEAARNFAGGRLHDDACLLLATRY